jgi:hypothetical protein
LPKAAKSSGTKGRSSGALDKLLKVGTDVKRLYDEPEFRDLVASALLFAAKALGDEKKGSRKAPKPKATRAASKSKPARPVRAKASASSKAKARKPGRKAKKKG